MGPDEDGPLASVAGRDRYVDGQGDMDLRLLWLVPVARKRGGGLNQGDPLRFLTEAIWFPASVLSRHISWEPVDPTAPGRRCARAPSKGAALFSFDEQGRPHMMAAQRYNDARRRLEHWTIPIRAYGQVHGIQVATEAGGVWNYESGDFYLPPLAHYRHSPQPTRSLPERVGKRAAAKA